MLELFLNFGANFFLKTFSLFLFLIELLSLINSGTNVEGVFRVSGQFSDVNKLKSDIDMGIDVDLATTPIHTTCGAIKSYIRELPDPLLTLELFDGFTQMAST